MGNLEKMQPRLSKREVFRASERKRDLESTESRADRCDLRERLLFRKLRGFRPSLANQSVRTCSCESPRGIETCLRVAIAGNAASQPGGR